MSARIFISYRRADSRGFSHAIYNYLVDHFSEPEIFMDVDDIEPGSDFHDILKDAVDACDVMIVLIGPKWINITDAEGNRRLDNPLDFVRVEVSRGLERNIKVIPVLVDGAQPVKVEELPENLKPLARLNVLFVGDQFNLDMDRLVPVIERELEEAKKKRDRRVTKTEQPFSKDTKKFPKWVMWGGGVVLIFILIGSVFGLRSMFIDKTNITNNGDTNDTNTPTSARAPTSSVTNTPAPTSTPKNIVKNGELYIFIPAGGFEVNIGLETVTVPTNAFYIGQTEVTNNSYRNCVDDNNSCASPANLDRFRQESYSDHPVVYVDWNAAQNYCHWVGGSLPSEVEWEKAARGGLPGRLYPWGNENPVCTKNAFNGAQYACPGRDGQTVPVRSFAPNDYGLYDMAGNVWEWVSNCGQDDPYTIENEGENVEPGCRRVVRGGSWNNDKSQLQVDFRDHIPPESADGNYGFRCVLSEPQ